MAHQTTGKPVAHPVSFGFDSSSDKKEDEKKEEDLDLEEALTSL